MSFPPLAQNLGPLCNAELRDALLFHLGAQIERDSRIKRPLYISGADDGGAADRSGDDRGGAGSCGGPSGSGFSVTPLTSSPHFGSVSLDLPGPNLKSSKPEIFKAERQKNAPQKPHPNPNYASYSPCGRSHGAVAVGSPVGF